jgi:hypothetical protein
MATWTIQGGKSFETLTVEEWRAEADRRERERARGVKPFDYAVPLTSSPANVISVGPEEGWIWAVRIVSSTLGSAGTYTVYKSSNLGTSTTNTPGQTTRLMGYNGTSQTAQAIQFPGDTFICQHGTAVYIVASTTLTNYYIGGFQVIAEQAWKLM